MSTPEPLLRREDCLLVVIDVQEKLMPVIAERDQVTANVMKLCQFAGIIGLPALVSEQMRLGPTLEPVKTLLPTVTPVEKITFDCLGEPAFVQALEATGRSTLLLVGVESHICVAQTALSAAARYRVQVVSDAISSRSLHNWVVAVERLRMNGITVTSTEMLMYELLGAAGTPEFKATLPLVK